jgi:hypothetical protein
MEKCEDVASILSQLDLQDIEQTLSGGNLVVH